MTLLDAAIVAVFLLYSLASGLRSRKVSSQNLEQYFLAGRTLPGWKAGVSMAATQFAADTPLLVTGLIATGGVFSLWRLWIYALAFLFVGFVLGGAWRRARVLTDAELAELRYGTRSALALRATKAVYFGLVFNCAVLAMVLFAAARIAEPFLRWNEWLPAGSFHQLTLFVDWLGLSLSGAADPAQSASNFLSIFVVIAVTALYSTTGGLRAVVNTDVAQFAVAMIATLVYAVILVDHVGGLSRIPAQLSALYGAVWTTQTLAFTPDHARHVSWALLGTIGIQWIAQMNADGTGYIAQRTMACRSDRDARQAAVIFTVAQILLRSLCWIPIGLALLVLIPMDASSSSTAAREATFVTGIASYLPAGVLGLMLTGMLAALASTLDTHLNWGASYWTNDVYKRLICETWLRKDPSQRALVWVARFSNLVIIVLAIAVLTRLDSIQSAWKVSLLLGAGMGAPLILRWLWWRVTAAAELAAIGVSTLLAPLLLGFVDGDGTRMLAMTAATTSVVVAVSLLQTATPSAALMVFYQRVKPPGYWGPVASACGDDPHAAARRLGAGIASTLAVSLGVFCLLVGIGSLLVSGPAPTWFPWRAAWIAVLLGLAAVLLAWAWRSGSAS
ncbi:MAG TPA: sodium:solute symporter family protein, partial [Myxococcota bacterium]|nr:sodium:solute symporter family protein [Myxococcota bacterium]